MQLPQGWLGPLVMLAATPACFFAAGRRGYRSFGVGQSILRLVVALPLGISGIAHFARTAQFAAIVPPPFTHPGMWVQITGGFELMGFAGLIIPETARLASVGVAVLMIAVFPANIYAAGRVVGGIPMPSVPVRLAMQVIYVLMVLIGAWGVPGFSAGADPEG